MFRHPSAAQVQPMELPVLHEDKVPVCVNGISDPLETIQIKWILIRSCGVISAQTGCQDHLAAALRLTAEFTHSFSGVSRITPPEATLCNL